MNICTFLGRIVRDLEVQDANGTSLLRFAIAVSRKYKDRNGKTAEEVNFLDMVAWDKGAEIIAKHFKKGDPIIVHAAAKQEQWEKDGQKRSAIVFRVNSFEFVPSNGGARRNDEGVSDSGSTEETKSSSPSTENSGNDDIPF